MAEVELCDCMNYSTFYQAQFLKKGKQVKTIRNIFMSEKVYHCIITYCF